MSSADVSCKEKYSRCIALEEDYVHQVYESIGRDLAQAKDPMKDTVRNFLDGLEPGSLVADIGCGDGKHLRSSDGVFSIGAERSSLQASLAREQCQEVLLGDNLSLPYRSGVFDAALSVEVLHHFTTKERRIEALQEISRILKVGGRVLITVQRHNNKISQDVLIPWFDVPKEKKVKESDWLEDDNFEYADTKEEEEDEDSISLPSSDEEDSSWINDAKFFKQKKYNADFEGYTKNLACKSTTASKDVPNKQQLAQNNTCYAFVQRAFKRFSLDYATADDQYLKPQFGIRDNSAVPLDSVSESEEMSGLLNCSSFRMNENLLRTISDNFIELRNIDNDGDTSKLSTVEECISDPLSSENSKLIKNKSSLIRSISDIFRNMNSLWSSKNTKSCSDLKSLGANNISLKEKENIRNRLVRSRTTTTCSPELDRIKPLEHTEEDDMTMNEANQIINDLLNSSSIRVESVKSKKSASVNNTLNNYDIINGNKLPSKCRSGKKSKSKDKFKSSKRNIVSKMPLLKEEEFSHIDSMYDLSVEEKSTTSESEKLNYFQSVQFLDKMIPDLLTNSGRNSKSVIYNMTENFGNEKIFHGIDKKEKSVLDKKLLEAELRKEYSFLYDDEYDEDEEDLEICSDIDEYEARGIWYKQHKLIETKFLDTSFFHDENFYSENFESEILEKRPTKTNCAVKNVKEYNMTGVPVQYGERNYTSNKIIKNDFYESSNKPCVKYSHFNVEDAICDFDYCTDTDSLQTESAFQNSPKKRQKTHHNDYSQYLEENTLGPFYDEDSDCTYTPLEYSLASYYSMPELHEISEFYDEYRLYQNYLLDTISQKLPNYEYSHIKDEDMHSRKDNSEIEIKEPKSEKVDENPRKNIISMENEIQSSKPLDIELIEANKEEENKLQTTKYLDFSLKLEKNDLEECLISESSIENMKIELCNNIQTAFTSTKSPLDENKLENIPTIPEITLENEKETVPLSFEVKSDSFVDLDNKLTSEFNLNSRSSAVDSYNNSIFFSSLGMSRSCSSLLENANLNKFVEIPSLSNISTSQPSLKFSPKKDIKLNLNKYRLNQINLYHSLSSEILVDDDIFSNLLKRTSENNIYSKQNMCALKEMKGDNDESVRIITNILENSPHEVSYISSSNSKEIAKKWPIFSKPALKNEFISHSQFLNTSKNFLESVLNTEKLSKSGSMKLTDPYYENRHFTPVSQNTKQCKETLNSVEKPHLLGNYVYSVRDLNNFEQILYLNELSDEKSVEVQICDENLPQNFTNTVITHENSCTVSRNPLQFTKENISKTETQSLLFDGSASVQCKKDAKCCKNVLETDEKSISSVSSITVDNLDQSHNNATESKCSAQIESDTINLVEKSHTGYSAEKTGTEEDCINYTYGKIHEDGAAVVSHRYHHLFQEEELYDLIENNISDLHVLDSFAEELHLYIIAEKVRVWTI